MKTPPSPKSSKPKTTGKPPFPINFDEITSQPKKFTESATQSLIFSPPSPSAPPQKLEQAKATDQVATQQKIAQVRDNIQKLEDETEHYRREREEERPTARFSQDQPPPQEESQESLPTVQAPSAPQKGPAGPTAAAQRKARRIETRSRVAGT